MVLTIDVENKLKEGGAEILPIKRTTNKFTKQ